MPGEIMVSINCNTYNHEKYISDAIESFLMQKTDFNYEILIHDDASTDRTPEIIKKYESKYPDLIKPIYQKENQYSKGIKVGRLNSERAKGKYIAICEGDDYWTDPYKLQKQVDYMEKHTECSLCVHAAYRVRPDKTKLRFHIRPNHGNKVFKVDEVIQGGGGLFATNSMLYPASLIKSLPDFYKKAPVEDYPLVIYLALNGKVYYIDEFMSAYRIGVNGSWTMLTASSIENLITQYNKISAMLDDINRYTQYKYDTVIKNTKRVNDFNLMIAQERFKEIKVGEYKIIYDGLFFEDKFKIFIKQYFPVISRALKIIKRKYKEWVLK